MKYEIEGYGIDELIKTLHRKNFQIKNLKKLGIKKVVFEIPDSQEKRAKRYILNFKIKQQPTGILKRFAKCMICNLGIVLGCFSGLIFFWYTSGFLWQIKVFGNIKLSKEEIIEVLKDNNIKIGAKSNIKCDEIENILLNKCDKIAQVSVIKVGTTIVINLSEKLIYEKTEYAPLIAKRSGFIKSINVITGTSNVKIGDFVNVGDVLVLPFILDSVGNKVSVNPIAEIRGEIYHNAKIETPKSEKVLIRSGNSKVETNIYFKNKFLFGNKHKKMFDIFETVVYNESISRLVPLKRQRVVYYEMIEQIVEHDFEKEKQSIIKKCEEIANKQRPSGDLVNSQTISMVLGDTLVTSTTLTILGDFCA